MAVSNDNKASKRIRIALAQIAYWPAYYSHERDYLLTPTQIPAVNLGQLGKVPLVPIKTGYIEILQRKVEAILESCQLNGVDLLVFPEYSIPLELLPCIKDQTLGGMTVVAGSHRVSASPDKQMYEKLGFKTIPQPKTAIAPVFLNGTLLFSQQKLSASSDEQTAGGFTPGLDWIVGRVHGHSTELFICSDYLELVGANGTYVVDLVDKARKSKPDLERASALCVLITCTGKNGLAHYDLITTVAAAGHHQISIVCNDSRGGGTTVVAPSRSRDPQETEAIPKLENDDEAVLIADVDMSTGYDGGSARYAAPRRATTVAILPVVYESVQLDKQIARALDYLTTPAELQLLDTIKQKTDSFVRKVPDQYLRRTSWDFQINSANRRVENGEVDGTPYGLGRVLVRGEQPPLSEFEEWIRLQTWRNWPTHAFEPLYKTAPNGFIAKLGDNLGKLRARGSAEADDSQGGVEKRLRDLVENRPFHLDLVNPARYYFPNLGSLSSRETIDPKTNYWLAVMEIITGNPGDPARVEAYEKTFVLPHLTAKGVRVANPVNAILAALRSRSSFTALVGRRGSGKSSLINYVVTTQHQKLQDAKVCWLRTDAAKLYRLRLKLVSQLMPTIRLIEYQALHALWVLYVAANKNRDRALDLLFTALQTEESPWRTRDSQTCDSLNALVAHAEDLATQLGAKKLLDSGSTRDQSEKYVEELHEYFCKQVPNSDIRLKYLLTLSRAFSNLLNECGWQISHIIDGVDNTGQPHLKSLFATDKPTPANQEYETLLLEVLDQMTQEGKSYGYETLLVCMREGTWVDLKSLAGLTDGRETHAGQSERQPRRSSLNTRVSRISIANNSASGFARTVFSKKLAFAREALQSEGGNFYSHFAIECRDALEAITPGEFDAVASLLSDCVEHMFRPIVFRRMRNNPYSQSSSAEEKLVDLLYNGSYRSFVSSAVRTALYVISRFREAQKISDKELSFSEFIKNKHYLFEEGSLLSGSDVFAKQFFSKRTGVTGDWCPPLFFNGTASQSGAPEQNGYWPGLVSLRVLQTVKGILSSGVPGARLPSEWIPIIGEMFGYTTTDVSNSVARLIDYSLLTKVGENPDGDDSRTVELRVTDKGKYIFESLTFSDPATLYHMALHAPFCAEIWNESAREATPLDTRLFAFHLYRDKENMTVDRQWWSAMLKTSITFLRHVHHFDKLECQRLRQNRAKIGAERFRVSADAVIAWYQRPSLSGWYSAIASRLAPSHHAGQTPDDLQKISLRRDILSELEKVIAQV